MVRILAVHRSCPLIVILNPAAGSSFSAAEDQITSALAAAGLRAPVRVVEPDTLRAAVREAARSSEIVGVAGGDGTLSTAAEVIAETTATLAPFPMGTRNHFARRLGIDSVEAAAHAVASGRTRLAPLGTLAGRTFIHHASAGIYPRMVQTRERIRLWSGKRAGNVLAGAWTLMRMDAEHFALRVNGVLRERTAPGLWVGIGRDFFRLPVDGHPPDDTCLEVVLAETKSRSAFVARGVRALWHLRRAQPLERAGLEVIRTDRFTLESESSIDVSRDGEVDRLEPPIEFQLHPEALKVMTLAAVETRSSGRSDLASD